MKINEFIEKGNLKFKNKFDYSLIKDIHFKKNKLPIKCPIHKKFYQSPSAHLRSKYGCPKCARMNMTKLKTKTINEVILDFKSVHKERYDYKYVMYKNNTTKVKIKCNECNSIFEQRPKDHMKGKGCSFCNRSGFNNSKHSKLYYIKIEKDNKILYKIGITNISVKSRFREDMKFITILKEESFKTGLEARNRESFLLKKYKKFKYKGPKILPSGNTEMFVIDILNLDI